MSKKLKVSIISRRCLSMNLTPTGLPNTGEAYSIFA